MANRSGYLEGVASCHGQIKQLQNTITDLRARLKTSRSDAFEEVAREYETTAKVLEQAVREKRYPKQDCEMCARIAVEERARAKRVRERAKVPAWPKGTEQDGE